MFSVWQENETLRRDIASLEREYAAKTKHVELDQQLDMQVRFCLEQCPS